MNRAGLATLCTRIVQAVLVCTALAKLADWSALASTAGVIFPCVIVFIELILAGGLCVRRWRRLFLVLTVVFCSVGLVVALALPRSVACGCAGRHLLTLGQHLMLAGGTGFFASIAVLLPGFASSKRDLYEGAGGMRT